MNSTPIIHAIATDLELTSADFLKRAAGVMRALGPQGCVHLRAKVLGGRHLYSIAQALWAAQESTGCWVVINDRVDVALAARCRGVQLGKSAMAAGDIRPVAPGLAIGVSVHSVVEAQSADQGHASWLLVGHVFETLSHGAEPGRGVILIEHAAAAVQAPVIAIGGVLPEHVAELRRAGAQGVAAIRGIWSAPDAALAASDYLSEYGVDRY